MNELANSSFSNYSNIYYKLSNFPLFVTNWFKKVFGKGSIMLDAACNLLQGVTV